jgi:hypothetical protein
VKNFGWMMEVRCWKFLLLIAFLFLTQRFINRYAKVKEQRIINKIDLMKRLFYT